MTAAALVRRFARHALALALFGLLTLVGGSSLAQALAPLAAPPVDAPLLAPPLRVALPPVPAGYLSKDLGWIRFHYPQAATPRVEPLIRDAEAVRRELSEKLGQAVLDRVEIRVASTAEEMASLAPVGAPPPEYASGVAYSDARLVILSLMPPRGAEAVDLDEVFRHELAHVALADAVEHVHVPRWFNEGFAVVASGESAGQRLRTLWDATLSGTLVPLSELDRSFPQRDYQVSIAYAESADFVRYLLRESDRARFASLVARVRSGHSFDRALTDAYGADARKLEFQWHADLDKRFSVIPALTGGSLLWVVAGAAMGWVYVKKRRRAKKILDRWAHEEAAEDALRVRLEAIRAQAPDEPLAYVPGAPRSRELPRVEHAGSWHTLH